MAVLARYLYLANNLKGNKQMRVPVLDMRVNEQRIPYLRSVYETDITDDVKQDSAKKIAEVIQQAFHAASLPEERLWMISLDGACHMTGIFEIGRGTAIASTVSQTQILQRALLSGAVSVAICHVHPSGDVTPSTADYQFTEKAKEVLEICGIRFLDHVIISGANREEFYSFYNDGKL